MPVLKQLIPTKSPIEKVECEKIARSSKRSSTAFIGTSVRCKFCRQFLFYRYNPETEKDELTCFVHGVAGALTLGQNDIRKPIDLQSYPTGWGVEWLGMPGYDY